MIRCTLGRDVTTLVLGQAGRTKERGMVTYASFEYQFELARVPGIRTQRVVAILTKDAVDVARDVPQLGANTGV